MEMNSIANLFGDFYIFIYLGNTIRVPGSIRHANAMHTKLHTHSLRCHHSALSIGSARATPCMRWKCHVWYKWNASKQFVECGDLQGLIGEKCRFYLFIIFICQWQVVQEDNNHFLSEYLAQFADKLPSDGESEDQNTSMVINTMLVTSECT